MPVDPEHFHAAGAVHGSVYFKALADAQLFDAEQRQIARGSGSFMRSAIPLSPDLGYL